MKSSPLGLCAVPFLTLLATWSAGCASTGSHEASNAPMHHDADAKGSKDDDAGEKLDKAKFDLECSKLELAIKRLTIKSEEQSSQQSVDEAERDLRDAKESLEDFKHSEGPLKADDAKLDLEQAAQMRKQRQQELDELMAMYKKEELATLTKELVIDRETKALEFAQRRLDMQTKSTKHVTDVELPKKERDLTEAVQKAERKLDDARAKIEKQKLDNKLDMLKAEHQVADNERALVKLQKKDGAA